MPDADRLQPTPCAEAASTHAPSSDDWRAAAAQSVSFLDFECGMPVPVATALRGLRAALAGEAIPDPLQREIDRVQQDVRGGVGLAAARTAAYLEGLLFASQCAPFAGDAPRLAPAASSQAE